MTPSAGQGMWSHNKLPLIKRVLSGIHQTSHAPLLWSAAQQLDRLLNEQTHSGRAIFTYSSIDRAGIDFLFDELDAGQVKALNQSAENINAEFLPIARHRSVYLRGGLTAREGTNSAHGEFRNSASKQKARQARMPPARLLFTMQNWAPSPMPRRYLSAGPALSAVRAAPGPVLMARLMLIFRPVRPGASRCCWWPPMMACCMYLMPAPAGSVLPMCQVFYFNTWPI